MAPRRRLRALRVRLRRISPPLRFGAFPLRLMLRAVEPLNMLRSIRILSVGLRPTPRTPGTSALCLAFGVWGSAPTMKSPQVWPTDRACVMRSKGGALAEPTLRSVGVLDKMERDGLEWGAVNYPDAPGKGKSINKSCDMTPPVCYNHWTNTSGGKAGRARLHKPDIDGDGNED